MGFKLVLALLHQVVLLMPLVRVSEPTEQAAPVHRGRIARAPFGSPRILGQASLSSALGISTGRERARAVLRSSGA